MSQKEKHNAKKILALILSLACVIGMLAGCGRQNAGEDNAEGSSSEEPSSDTWYEIDQEAGILTVRLPAEKEGFIWNFTINDTTLLELDTQEDNDGTFVASFRALEDGETVVSFSYAKDDALEEIRALNVTCKDGKVAGISNASVMPISGQDDPEITDLRNSNSISMIMKEHSAVTCVSETWDGKNTWQYKTVRQFVSSDGRLWYDYEQYDDADQVVYCEAGYINDDVPGALYTCEKDGLKTMTLCSASEYEAMASDRWLAHQAGDYETVTDKTDSTEYGTSTLTATRENRLTGVSSEVIYFIDDATGLINGMEVTEHSAEDGSVVSVTRSNILYDEPRLMEEQAAMNIRFPEDACYLNVVINPGKENSEEQAFQVDKSTEVEFDAMEGYQMYYDYDCTQPMDWIDAGQNKLTVYITVDPAK